MHRISQTVRNREGKSIEEYYTLVQESITKDIAEHFNTANNPLDIQRLLLRIRLLIIEKLLEQGFTKTAIAKVLNSSRSTISKLLN